VATGVWIDSTRKSMQRLGFLSCVCSLASPDRPGAVSDLARKLYEALSKRHTVDLGPASRLAEYLVENKLPSTVRYSELDASRLGKSATYPFGVEAQDLQLSDSLLPSSTGAITRDVVDEPVKLAVQLGLLRDSNVTLTGTGQLVRLLRPTAHSDLRDLGPNPLALTPGERLIWSVVLWQADRDVLRDLLPVLIDQGAFTRSSAGDLLPGVLERVIARHAKRAITADDRARLSRLDAVRKSVASRLGLPSGGTGRSREQFITLRLETAVDLGYLSKENRGGYEYRTNDRTSLVSQALGEGESGWDPVAAFASTMNPPLPEVLDEERVFKAVTVESEEPAGLSSDQRKHTFGERESARRRGGHWAAQRPCCAAICPKAVTKLSAIHAGPCG
jgi:hypothetical protein